MNKPTSSTPIDRFSSQVESLYQQAGQAMVDGNFSTSADDACPLLDFMTRTRERYQSPTLVGRGGMKEVYRVLDTRLTRHVALAKPLAKFSRDEFDSFLREAHLTARLEHPSIIDLYDIDVDDEGRPFFTMEFKRGHSLRGMLKKWRDEPAGQQPSIRYRVNLFLRICEAIAYAHNQRILHLDIKPENVQVGMFGEVQVCDWGMGEVIVGPSDSQNLDAQLEAEALLDPDLYGGLLDVAKGTAAYMSPEQRDRKISRTAQMDIYALGCLLYEIVTLRLLDRKESRPWSIDPALAAVVAKATAPLPQDRYLDVSLICEDVSRFLAGYSASVERKSFVREGILFYRRHRDICSVTLGSLLTLTLLAVLFIVQIRQERTAAVVARREAERERSRVEQAETRIKLVRQQAKQSFSNYVAGRWLSEDRVNLQIDPSDAQVDEIVSLALSNNELLVQAVEVAIDRVDAVISQDPSVDSNIWDQKFWLSMLTQDFRGAVAMLRSGKTISKDFQYFAQKYDWIVRQYHRDQWGRNFLTADDFANLIRELCQSQTTRANLAERMIVYDMRHPRGPGERLRIIRQWLACNNPHWYVGRIDLDAQNKTVRIEGLGFESLLRTLETQWLPETRVNLLCILEPEVLDLRGTDFADLEQLESLGLHQLDIRQTAVRDLRPLTRFADLRRLIIDPGQYTEEQLSGIPASLEIIEQASF